jgi:hypothetical protein
MRYTFGQRNGVTRTERGEEMGMPVKEHLVEVESNEVRTRCRARFGTVNVIESKALDLSSKNKHTSLFGALFAQVIRQLIADIAESGEVPGSALVHAP